VAQFPRWLERHLAHWGRDPAFHQRSRIRDLRRAHPQIRALEEERRRAQAEDRSSPLFPRLEAVARDLSGADKAVAGLTYALATADAAGRERLALKLESFRERAAHLRREERALTRASETRLVIERLTTRLGELRAALGLDREEARLRELQRKKGRSTGRSGAAFEEVALEAVR
jgi:hypothetical protein